MEMKRKQKHISLRCSNQGFTLIELMIAMVVSLLALAAIYSTFLAQHRSYQVQSETSDMQQNIRAAMYFMEREIRMAGSNPFKSLPLPSFGITAASQNSITFTEDVRGNAAGLPPDGDTGDSDENITYLFFDSDADGKPDSLARNDINGGGGNQIVARNIDAVDFVYLDGNSAVIPFVAGAIPAINLDQIRSVEITVVARTKDPLLYGAKNNISYVNQQGTQILAPQGDNVSRRRLSVLIHCRNLSL